MEKKVSLKRKITLSRGLQILVAGLFAVATYQTLPGGSQRMADLNPVIRIERHPRQIAVPEVLSHAPSAQVRQSLLPSIEALMMVKQRTPQQERQLRLLSQRYELLSRLEDHEMRLSLHQEDIDFDSHTIQLEVDNIKQALTALEEEGLGSAR